MHVPHVEVQQRREQQRPGAQEEAEAPAARVGHDAGGNLEDDLAEAEERVGGEGLGVAQPGVEQEERVDAPDERGGKGREQRQDEVDPLDGSGRIGHAATLVLLGHTANQRVFGLRSRPSRHEHAHRDDQEHDREETLEQDVVERER